LPHFPFKEIALSLGIFSLLLMPDPDLHDNYNFLRSGCFYVKLLKKMANNAVLKLKSPSKKVTQQKIKAET